MARIDGPHHHHHIHHHGVHHTPPPPPTTTGASTTSNFTNGATGTQAPVTSSGSCSCTLPPPSTDQSHAPAGVGLTVGGESPFGPNAVTTAGGYTIVPTGKDMAWDIYAPGQKPGDTPNSHIWGDPHVTEKDGTKWDFTRSSNFRLPDGTNINVKTVPYNGDEAHRLSGTLDITNGADRVQITGVDQNKPVVGKVSHDGYQSRAELASQDTFTLGGTQDDVKWFKSVDGHNQGEVTGASMVTQADGTAAYEQNVKAGDYVVDPSLQPKVGTEAWGNMLRDSLVDTARNMYGGKSLGAELVAFGAGITHTENTKEGRAVANEFSKVMQQLKNMMWLFNFMDVGTSSRNLNAVSGR